jgi:predicted DNA-binding mobile mystery protein A
VATSQAFQLVSLPLDRSLASFAGARSISRPKLGWLRAVRESLGITKVEVAHKMRQALQTVAWFEKSEENDRITLRDLRSYAEALDCQLAYAVVRQAGSWKQRAENRAREKAEAHALAVERTMAPEDQATNETSEKTNRKADGILER